MLFTTGLIGMSSLCVLITILSWGTLGCRLVRRIFVCLLLMSLHCCTALCICLLYFSAGSLVLRGMLLPWKKFVIYSCRPFLCINTMDLLLSAFANVMFSLFSFPFIIFISFCCHLCNVFYLLFSFICFISMSAWCLYMFCIWVLVFWLHFLFVLLVHLCTHLVFVLGHTGVLSLIFSFVPVWIWYWCGLLPWAVLVLVVFIQYYKKP